MSQPVPEMGLPRGVGLLLLLLDPRHRDLFAGDLLEEYQRFVLPTRGRSAGRLWLWRNALKGTAVGFTHRVYDKIRGFVGPGGKAPNGGRDHAGVDGGI